MPLYVHFLGIESYGLIGLYASWAAVAGILDMGISATASREIVWFSARGEQQKVRGFVRTLELSYWVLAAVLGLGVFAAVWWSGDRWLMAERLSPDVVRQALLLMAVLLVVQTPSGFYSAGLTGLQRQIECAAFLAAFATLRIGAGVAALSLVQPDIRIFFLSQIAAALLQAAVMRSILWKRLPASAAAGKFSLATLRSMGGFAGGMILITALSVTLGQMDKLILSQTVPLEQLGVYVLAWAIASGLMLLATPLMQSYGPRFTELYARQNHDDVVLNFGLAARAMTVLVLPPAILAIALSRELLGAWTGDAAIASRTAPVLEILVAGMAFVACSYPGLGLLYSRRKYQPVIRVNLTCFVVLLPLLFVSITHFGVTGAAWCWTIYGFSLWIAYTVSALYELGISRIALVMLRDFVQVGLSSYAVALLGGLWVDAVAAGGRLSLIPMAISLILGWVVAVLSFGNLRRTFVRTIGSLKGGR